MLLRLNGAATHYQGLIARQQVYSSLACSFLRSTPECPNFPTRAADKDLASAQLVHAELEGKAIQLTVRHGHAESYLESEQARAWVAADGSAAELELNAANENEQNSWLFGPVLILQLARRGVFCLHASSIRLNQRTLAVMGDSGVGKSSFARVLNQANCAMRLTDDITPIGFDDAGLKIYPHFPQLKLQTQLTGVSQQFALHGLAILEAAGAHLAPHQTKLNAADIHFRLMRHTVASRLFSVKDAHAWWAFAAKAQHELAACNQSYLLRARYAPGAVPTAMLEVFDQLISHDRG